jgi:2-keto-3-deoxy-L-rhamnonate aldolase RhmA
MKSRLMLVTVIAALLGTITMAQSRRQRLNPMIDLLEQHKIIAGGVPATYPRPQPAAGAEGRGANAAGNMAAAPAADVCGITPAPRGEGGNRGGQGRGGRGEGRGGGGGGGGAAPATAAASMDEAVRKTLEYKAVDFLNGSMEGGLDGQMPAFTDFMKLMGQHGALAKTPYPRLTHPYYLKVPKIARDPLKAIENISRQLNVGNSGIIFPAVECGKEVQLGLAAMRPKSTGGTRPDDYGAAPAYWGLTPQQYSQKADVWPLNPNGELVAWVIIESREGLKNVREIARTPGIGVLIPGSGTLGGVFSTTTPDGQRVRDDAAWENAQQTVLAACKEFKINCGFPASTPDVLEMRHKQGFNVFVLQSWSQASFDTIAHGRKLGGRTSDNQ